jgi:hypothetical protein
MQQRTANDLFHSPFGDTVMMTATIAKATMLSKR